MKIALTLLLFAFATTISAQTDKPLLDQLNEAIDQSHSYDLAKQETIVHTRKALNASFGKDLIEVYRKLYDEYKVFNYDSAYSYAQRQLDLAKQLQVDSLVDYARIKLSFILLSSGMFKETFDSLNVIQPDRLTIPLKTEYYTLLGRCYYDLADYINDKYHSPFYNEQGTRFLDSALLLYPSSSFSYLYYNGLKNIRAGNRDSAMIFFQRLIRDPNLTDHELALTASTVSDIYIFKGQTDTAINLLMRAIIADIRSSTKETSAAFNLANLLYKKGDVKNASACIEQAIADATFYGARQRKVKVSDVLPLIESEKLGLVEKQKRTLITYAIIVTLLLLGVIMLIIIVLRQLRKLKHAERVITEAHLKEKEINHRLSELNTRLSEANKIKEEYIGYFFNVNSEFFDKIERFKKNLEQKVNDRKLDEIKFLVNNINLRAEKEYLLQNFDRIFLKLFPNFVAEFNHLFSPENQIVVTEGELLNTDLRIFALIRMGIHDNEKIARILQYSVNTINTYKTKIKNRSLVANEEFEKKIMEIKAI